MRHVLEYLFFRFRDNRRKYNISDENDAFIEQSSRPH